MTASVSLRALNDRTDEVRARIAAGERIELTHRGEVVGVLSAPDPGERLIAELKDRGVIGHDWESRQRTLLSSVEGWPRSRGRRRRSASSMIEESRMDRV